MTMESAQKFFETLKENGDFAAKIAQGTDDKARMEIAQAAGFEFTLEELEAARDELDDSALDEVAGGLMKPCCENDGFYRSTGEGSGLIESGREMNSWGAPAPGPDKIL